MDNILLDHYPMNNSNFENYNYQEEELNRIHNELLQNINASNINNNTSNDILEQYNTYNFKNNLIDRSDNINEDITKQKNIIDNMLNSLKKDFREMSKSLEKADKNVKKYINKNNVRQNTNNSNINNIFRINNNDKHNTYTNQTIQDYTPNDNFNKREQRKINFIGLNNNEKSNYYNKINE